MCRDAVAAPRALQLIVYPISLKKSLLFCEKIEKRNKRLYNHKEFVQQVMKKRAQLFQNRNISKKGRIKK